MKITVVGIGYVGLSLSVLLSQKYQVSALDINLKKIESLKVKKSPIKDKDISNFLTNKSLKLNATINKDTAYKNASYVVIATPTSFDENTGSFNTDSVESVILDAINYVPNACIVIKSTIPFGFTDKMKIKYNLKNIFFSPEFLREGCALKDNLYPSRIVIGSYSSEAKNFGKILLECSCVEDDFEKIHIMESSEAESVKLFSNTYLAMRIAFFNELDTFAESFNLSSKKIIESVCKDSRIGNYYNNPSFGYGGYCLPKDTKQLLDSYGSISNNLIRAIVDSNSTRKTFICDSILKKKPKSVGIYRLTMKQNSDNFRDSAVLNLIEILSKEEIVVNLYEPLLRSNFIDGINLINNFDRFISSSEIILANRLSDELNKHIDKVYSRDIFNEN